MSCERIFISSLGNSILGVFVNSTSTMYSLAEKTCLRIAGIVCAYQDLVVAQESLKAV